MQVKNISDIKGYEHFKGYTIDETGKVESYWGRTRNSKGQWTKNKIDPEFKHILNIINDSKGYSYIDLRYDGIRKNPKIHQLVALAFIPNPNNKPQVNHIDGNKQNNNINNLEWVTNEERRVHALENNINIMDEIDYEIGQYDLNDNLIAVFPTIKKALASLGINGNYTGNIGRVIRGNRKSAYGYKWKQYTDSKNN